jgi:hypothetical protein
MVTSDTKAARLQGTSVVVGIGVFVFVGDAESSVAVAGGGVRAMVGGGSCVSPAESVSRASTVWAAYVGSGSGVEATPGRLQAIAPRINTAEKSKGRFIKYLPYESIIRMK